MPIVQPGTLRDNELPEFAIRGPFGGIQSEAPLDAIEEAGFADALNILFRKGAAQVRGSFTATALMPNPQEPICGIADFFDVAASRHTVIMTPTRLLEWNSVSQDWSTVITGVLTGAATNLFRWAVVGQKLCFCQGVDKVKIWDGISVAFADASPNAVPARYLAEIANHLVVGDCIIGGTRAPQRVMWTGAGDPTDWTSLSSGQTDLFNDLGPITGLIKLYQSGFVMQNWGVTQATPTGQGLKPFDFVSLSSHSKGNVAPHSLAPYGESHAPYIGKDNVYDFNGVQSVPIGDLPVANTRWRLGARRRIFADLAVSNLQTVWGFTSTSIGGQDYNAYWIIIPTVSCWIFNFDEFNWTRVSFPKIAKTAGVFSRRGIIRIMDLVGTISDQSWTPITLVSNEALDIMLIGCEDGTPLAFDFTGVSESGWLMLTAQLTMKDHRHEKTVKKLRLSYRDVMAAANITVSVANEKGVIQTKTKTLGTGSGKVKTAIYTFDVPGYYLMVQVSGDAGVLTEITEITPIYDVGGELRS